MIVPLAAGSLSFWYAVSSTENTCLYSTRRMFTLPVSAVVVTCTHSNTIKVIPLDKITLDGGPPSPNKTNRTIVRVHYMIYWGSVPFVIIQVIMVGLVIAFPAMVMHYKGSLSTVDPNKVKIEIPQMEMPQLDFGPPGGAK